MAIEEKKEKLPDFQELSEQKSSSKSRREFRSRQNKSLEKLARKIPVNLSYFNQRPGIAYKSFDSQGEVQGIMKLKPGSYKKHTLRKRQEIKRRKLKNFKENLIDQQKGIAEIQIILESRIRENPDAGYGELRSIVWKNANRFRLTGRQIERIEKGIREYMHKHGAVEFSRKKYPDDRDLFQACFNRRPEGDIEVIKGPMTLYFRCHSLRDYAHIYNGDFSGSSEIGRDHLRTADKSGGASIEGCAVADLQGCIIAENSKGGAVNKKTLDHEELHAIKRLFDRKLVKGNISEVVAKTPIEEREEKLRALLRSEIRAGFEERAKGEFLAYFKEGVDQSEAAKKLLKTDDGLYDYYWKWLKNEGKYLLDDLVKVGMNRVRVQDIFQLVFEEEYANVITRAGYAMSDLENKWHMTDEEIINILINEPLLKWPKLVRRLEILDADYQGEAKTDLLRYFRQGMDLFNIGTKLEDEASRLGNYKKFSRFKESSFRALEYLLENKFTRGEIVRLLENRPVREWDATMKKAVEEKKQKLARE